MRSLGGGAAAVVLAALLSACEDEGSAFATQPLGCTPSAPSEATDARARTLTEAEFLVVLEDAATRLAPSLAESGERDRGTGRLTTLSSSLARATPLARCLALEDVRMALEALPSDPAREPDRALLRMTLDVLAAQVERQLP